MRDLIVYDLEISKTIEEAGGWNNHNNMGLGSAVAYSTNQDRYFFFLHESEKPKLLKLLNGNRVVTYNGIKFDSKVMLGEDRKIQVAPGGIGIEVSSNDGSISWVEFDIYLHIIKSQHNLKDIMKAIPKFSTSGKGGLKLGAVAKATLGDQYDKTGDGSEAPLLYKDCNYGALL